MSNELARRPNHTEARETDVESSRTGPKSSAVYKSAGLQTVIEVVIIGIGQECLIQEDLLSRTKFTNNQSLGLHLAQSRNYLCT